MKHHFLKLKGGGIGWVMKHKSKGGGGWRDRAGGGIGWVMKHNHAKKYEIDKNPRREK